MKPEEAVMLIMGAPSYGDALEELKRYRAAVLEEARIVAVRRLAYLSQVKDAVPWTSYWMQMGASGAAEKIAAEIEKLKGEKGEKS